MTWSRSMGSISVLSGASSPPSSKASQWCSRNSQAAWGALFQRPPAPTVVVCDGGPGMHAALKEHWPETRVQRCLVHLQRNVRKYTTTRSKTTVGKVLWGLALRLTRVKTPDGAAR